MPPRCGRPRSRMRRSDVSPQRKTARCASGRSLFSARSGERGDFLVGQVFLLFFRGRGRVIFLDLLPDCGADFLKELGICLEERLCVLAADAELVFAEGVAVAALRDDAELAAE